MTSLRIHDIGITDTQTEYVVLTAKGYDSKLNQMMIEANEPLDKAKKLTCKRRTA